MANTEISKWKAGASANLISCLNASRRDRRLREKYATHGRKLILCIYKLSRSNINVYDTSGLSQNIFQLNKKLQLLMFCRCSQTEMFNTDEY